MPGNPLGLTELPGKRGFTTLNTKPFEVAGINFDVGIGSASTEGRCSYSKVR